MKSCNCGGMLYKKAHVGKMQAGNVITSPFKTTKVMSESELPSDTVKKVDPNSGQTYWVRNNAAVTPAKPVINKHPITPVAKPVVASTVNKTFVNKPRPAINKTPAVPTKSIEEERFYLTPQTTSVVTQKPIAATQVQQVRKRDTGWNSHDVEKYIYPNDKGEYTHDTKEVYIDRKTGQEVDMNTSYDSTGKYLPKFLNTVLSPATNAGTYTKGLAPAMKKGGILKRH